MKTATKSQKDKKESYIAKIGTSRQVAIPKKIYDRLNLDAGDYVEIVAEKGRLIFTPKVFIEKRIAEGLKDIKEGRTIGPFSNVKDAVAALKK